MESTEGNKIRRRIQRVLPVRLEMIFGKKTVAAMSAETRSAAEKVIIWEEFAGWDGTGEPVEMRNARVVALVKEIAEREMGENVSDLYKPYRGARVVDLRRMMYKMLYDASTYNLKELSPALGTGQKHCTVLTTLERFNDLYYSDAMFKRKYEMLWSELQHRLHGDLHDDDEEFCKTN